MSVIKEYILALVLVVVATTVHSATEEDYPEVELPGVVLPPSNAFRDNVRYADPPCLPDKWQANITSQTGISGGRGGGKATVINNLAIYVDKAANQIAGKGDGGGRFHNKSGGFVMRFKDNKADFYLFSFTDQKCKHTEIKNATFKPQCIPVNSTMQEVTLGPADGGLKAQAWRFRAKSPQDRRGMRMFVSGTFLMTESKLPVASVDRGMISGRRPHEDINNAITFDQSEDDEDVDRRGRRGGIKFVSSTYYSSAKPSIDDPSVFTPPSYCNATATAMPLESVLSDEEEFTEILERFVSF